jgi:hypothetical protein
VTKSTYRKLKAIWIIGSAAMIAMVVASWMRLLPFSWFLLLILVVGGPAAFSGWILRDQEYQELPD